MTTVTAVSSNVNTSAISAAVSAAADAADEIASAVYDIETLFSADAAAAVAAAVENGKCPRKVWIPIENSAYVALYEYAAAPSFSRAAILYSYVSAARRAVGKQFTADDIRVIDMYMIKGGASATAIAGKSDFRKFLRGEFVAGAIKATTAAAKAFDKVAGTDFAAAMKEARAAKKANIRPADEEYIRAYIEHGYSREDAEILLKITKGAENLIRAQRKEARALKVAAEK